MADDGLTKTQQAEVQAFKNNAVYNGLFEFYSALKMARPNDKSPLDRYYGVVLTDFEHLLAYVHTFILRGVRAEVDNGGKSSSDRPSGSGG